MPVIKKVAAPAPAPAAAAPAPAAAPVAAPAPAPAAAKPAVAPKATPAAVKPAVAPAAAKPVAPAAAKPVAPKATPAPAPAAAPAQAGKIALKGATTAPAAAQKAGKAPVSKGKIVIGGKVRKETSFAINEGGRTTREALIDIFHKNLTALTNADGERIFEGLTKRLSEDILGVAEATLLEVTSKSSIKAVGAMFRKVHKPERIYSLPTTPLDTYVPEHDYVSYTRYAEPGFAENRIVRGRIVETPEGYPTHAEDGTPLTYFQPVSFHADQVPGAEPLLDSKGNATTDKKTGAAWITWDEAPFAVKATVAVSNETADADGAAAAE